MLNRLLTALLGLCMLITPLTALAAPPQLLATGDQSEPSPFMGRITGASDERVAVERPLDGTEVVLRQTCTSTEESQTVRVESEVAGGKMGGDIALVDWRVEVHSDSGDRAYRPLTYRDQEWHGSTFWTGADWTRVGKNWQHTGNATPSVRRFRAPRSGRITVSGRVFKADVNNGGGDGVRAEVRHNTAVVWSGEIDGDDKTGVTHEVPLDVQAGDAIRFVLDKRGTIAYDTTYWDPCVAYDGGTRYLASEGFSDKTDGVWGYEHVADPNARPALPGVYWVDDRGGVGHAELIEGVDVTLGNDTALPLILLMDVSEEAGLLFALDSGAEWRFNACLRDGELSLGVTCPANKALPAMYVGSFRGGPSAGFEGLQRLLDTSDGPKMAALREDLPLAFMVNEAWRLEDGEPATADDYAKVTASHLERVQALLADLRREHGPGFLSTVDDELKALTTGTPSNDLATARARYADVRGLKRRIVLANPLMDFGPMVLCKRVPTSYSHLVMQYYGWRARPGGGLYVLEKPGRSLAVRDILQGQLPPGNVLEPRLSYDGKRIVFSYVACPDGPRKPEEIDNERGGQFYHIYEVNVDGTGLRQLTNDPFDDTMPTYLPDGGFAFCSTRRKGYARCFGAQFSKRWDTYTLHRMEGDGSDIRTLSYNDVNEWFPTVSNTGLIMYARWDYIDRDAVTHQNLWASRPDGTNPIAVWGNATPSPHCTFQMQPVPNSGKFVLTASAHHSVAGGSIVLLDPEVAADGEAAVTRLTPDVPFPEAESRDIREYYTAPWPLSEKYFLVAYSPTPLVWEPGANKENALGIYTLDAFGNRELIYRDPDIGATNPCPLRARPCPPTIPSQLPVSAPATGEVFVADVQHGLGDLEPGTVKELRIVQIFPKSTPIANTPPIGMAREENGRAILGTVPVEADGSARFLVPANKPFLFQALDEHGDAYQTMRSLTYLQPGEKISCAGCHESKLSAPPNTLASRRPPSDITPETFGAEPFSFMRMVQPVLDEHCTECHKGDDAPKDIVLTSAPMKGYTASYWSLCGDVDFWGPGTNPENAAKALVPRFGGRNQIQITPPGGQYGARGSRLMRMLRKGHKEVELSADELRRIAAWIDSNAIFYGVNDPGAQTAQLAGERVPMPELQ
ncbi:MAG: hypothetical protein GY851_33980 [bacterium]|nr:hypothetical protein [bacterium]